LSGVVAKDEKRTKAGQKRLHDLVLSEIRHNLCMWQKTKGNNWGLNPLTPHYVIHNDGDITTAEAYMNGVFSGIY